jgi:hypothetical protein
VHAGKITAKPVADALSFEYMKAEKALQEL